MYLEDAVNKLKKILLVSVFALTAGASGVQAALVNFTLVGSVKLADTPNGFGLNVNDPITVTGVFDDSLLSGSGAEEVTFSIADTMNSLNLAIGSMSFTQADDKNYNSGSPPPKLNFSNGDFNGFVFLTEFNPFGYFGSAGFSFDSADDSSNPNFVSGTWVNYSVAAVPVPAAVWLFGSGLLGLAGVARRKS